MITADRTQQAFDIVEHAVLVLLRHLILMRPAVSEISKLADQTAFNEGQVLAKQFIPAIPHKHKQKLSVAVFDLAKDACIASPENGLFRDIGPQSGGEQCQSSGNGVFHVTMPDSAIWVGFRIVLTVPGQ